MSRRPGICLMQRSLLDRIPLLDDSLHKALLHPRWGIWPILLCNDLQCVI